MKYAMIQARSFDSIVFGFFFFFILKKLLENVSPSKVLLSQGKFQRELPRINIFLFCVTLKTGTVLSTSGIFP